MKIQFYVRYYLKTFESQMIIFFLREMFHDSLTFPLVMDRQLTKLTYFNVFQH